MNCNGCRNYMEQALSRVNGINKAAPDLQKAETHAENERWVPFSHYKFFETTENKIDLRQNNLVKIFR